MRSDYKINRNMQIYEDYVNSSLSFNKLAQKYGLSPQRIRYIVNDFKDKELGNSLPLDASKEDREKYKNLAVSLREQGRYEMSIKMFDELVSWDEKNSNPRGKIDALGHKKIAIVSLSKKVTDKSYKEKYLWQAFDCISEAIKTGKNNKNEVPAGPLAIQYVHQASLGLLISEVKDLDKKSLKDGLEAIDTAIKDFPGSKAHLAWPLTIKAKILLQLEKFTEAFEVLQAGEKAIFDGYEEELGWTEVRKHHEEDKNIKVIGTDQALMKLNIWTTGINLTKAELYKKTGKLMLAEVYAQSVLKATDQTGTLKSRKEEARELLKEIKKLF